MTTHQLNWLSKRARGGAGGLCLILMLFLAQAGFAQAQESYPTRAIHVIVGYQAGGAADVVARIAMTSLSRRLHQPIIIDNKPGGGGNIAVDSAAHSDADGYTLHLLASGDAINVTLFKKHNFDIRHDLTAVAGLISLPNVLVVNLNLPVKSFADFVTYAREHSGKVYLSSPGLGTTSHLELGLLNATHQTNIQHIPYPSAAINAVVTGEVQGMFASIATGIPQIKAGAVRALYVTSDERSPILPDVPSIKEVSAAPDLNSWFGLDAPARTPPAIIARLNEELAQVLAEPEVIQHFATLGGVPLILKPADFGRFVEQEVDHYGKAVTVSGVSVNQ